MKKISSRSTSAISFGVTLRDVNNPATKGASSVSASIPFPTHRSLDWHLNRALTDCLPALPMYSIFRPRNTLMRYKQRLEESVRVVGLSQFSRMSSVFFSRYFKILATVHSGLCFL